MFWRSWGSVSCTAVIWGGPFSQQGCREGAVAEGLLWGRVLWAPREGPGWGCREEACSRVGRRPPGLADTSPNLLFWGIQLGINPRSAPPSTQRKPALPGVPSVPTESMKGKETHNYQLLPSTARVCCPGRSHYMAVLTLWLGQVGGGYAGKFGALLQNDVL